MLSKCANPTCNTPFRYSPGSRLFQVETHLADGSGEKHNQDRVELYWLCTTCYYIVLSSFQWDQESVTYPLSDGGGTRTITLIPLDEALIFPDSLRTRKMKDMPGTVNPSGITAVCPD
jgi:hypothetical protein